MHANYPYLDADRVSVKISLLDQRPWIKTMTFRQTQPLSLEWKILQNNYEQYEKSTLLIKLTSIILYAIGRMLAPNVFLLSAIVFFLWLQESIFRTYQSRLGTRILHIEELLRQPIQAEGNAFQLHSEWLAKRKGFAGLMSEYAANAARPTVAFPYLALLLIDLMSYSIMLR